MIKPTCRLKNIETKVSVSTASRNEKERTEKNVVAVVEGLVGFACVPVLFSSQSKIAAPGPQIHSSHRVSDPSTSSGITASSSSSSPSHYYACTLRSPQIVLERLSKDIADLANGPVNLIESIGIDLQFRKTLTRM